MKLAAAVLSAVVALAAPAMAQDTSGTLIPTDGGPPLEIQSQEVDIRINNGIAVTTITQVFKNNRNRALEAVYSFPIPNEASVSNFSMWINGKEVIGEVLEKRRARQIYESITRQRKDPGLLEQVSYKLFEVRVFPVPANGIQKIQIAYYQPVEYDAGFGTYVYPLEGKTRERSAVTGTFKLDVRLISDIPLTKVASPSHADDLAVRETSPGLWRASIETPRSTLDRDFVLVYTHERERSGLTLVPYREGRDDGYFMLLLTAGEELDRVQQPANYTFVLDISGSMGNARKLSHAIKMIQGLLEGFEETDRFNIVTFNIAPELLFEDGPTAISEASLAKARTFLDGLAPKGGTDLIPALEAASEQQVEGIPNAVILLSDGNATHSNNHSRFRDLLSRKGTETRIFSIGIGNEINRPLLHTLAELTGGYSDYISSFDDVTRKTALLKKKISHNVAEDLTLSFDGVHVYDVSPRKLPNLFRGQQLAVYGRYRKAGDAQVAIRGKIGGEEGEILLDVEFPDREADNPEVRRMWAWKRTDELMQGIRQKGESSRAVQDVIDLGTEYSIVTPYTSFLVLENDEQFKRFGIEQRNKEQIRRDRAAQARRSDTRTARAPRSHGGGGGGSIGLGVLGLLAVLAGGRTLAKRK